jgi:hypothetical protein
MNLTGVGGSVFEYVAKTLDVEVRFPSTFMRGEKQKEGHVRVPVGRRDRRVVPYACESPDRGRRICSCV